MSTSQLEADLITENRELREQYKGALQDLALAEAQRHALATSLRAAEDKIAEQHELVITLRARLRVLEDLVNVPATAERQA